MLKVSHLAAPISLLIGGIGSAAHGQAANVSIEATSPDDVGRRIVASLRQKVASSRLMTYVSSDAVASLRLHIVTMNPDTDRPTSQTQTIYSQVITFHPQEQDKPEVYLTSGVGNCGGSRVDSCADSIYADLDQWAERLRRR